jgi:hypothetical protein
MPRAFTSGTRRQWLADAGKVAAAATAPSKRITLGFMGPGEIRFPLRSEKADFIEACKTRGQTIEDAEVGQRTTSLCHLAHIAIQLGGTKLRWDPDQERFPDNEAANKLLKRPPMRGPWRLE